MLKEVSVFIFYIKLQLIEDPCILCIYIVLIHSFSYKSTGIVVTNDGNAILRELDLAHPAAKVFAVSFVSLH